MTAPAQPSLRIAVDRLRGLGAITGFARPFSRAAVSLGTGFIAIGAAVVFGLRACYELAWLAAHWQDLPQHVPIVIAWIVLLIVVATVLATSQLTDGRLSDRMFVVYLGGLATAIALDVVAIWPLHDIGRYSTAAVAAGMSLVAIITLRRLRDVLVTVVAIALILIALMSINTRPAPEEYAAQLMALSFALLPPVIAILMMSGFRRLVQVELDRVLVQSTVSAPPLAVGMMASDELARLDLAAEELLDSVADGTVTLPLQPDTASIAASLATELRLHLIEGRRKTWLYHAITESELLGKSVTLVDRTSLAGLLDPRQRDGLLTTAWLLISETNRTHRRRETARSVRIVVGPRGGESREDGLLRIPITITTTAISRNRVDPVTWNAIRRVGRYTDSSHRSNLRVVIECLVVNPMEQRL